MVKTMPSAQHAVEVEFPLGLRAVVDVEAEVVAGAVRHPAPVLLPVLAEGLLDRNREQAPFGKPLREDGGGGGVDVPEPRADPGGREPGVGGVQDGFVDLALDVRERAVGRAACG